MTINRDGKIVTYICPVCETVTRGLMNGMCNKCHTEREYLTAGFVPVKWITREELLRQYPMAD